MTLSPNPHGEILRAAIFHTPHDAFREPALETYSDGGLLLRDGVIAACGDFPQIRAAHADASVRDLRGGFLIPGLIDAHTHFPQIRVIGCLGRSLLDWLDHCALPEESRIADPAVAKETAGLFVRELAAHGTTTALVFGSHFAHATACLFEAAQTAGLRLMTGLVMSDRALRPELHQSLEAAYRESADLIGRFHGRGMLTYAVTPRFALAASEAMLEVCQTLLRENDGLRFQTHLNENRDEVAAVARAFPWAEDYLAVYERFGLAGKRSVMAHDVHATTSQLQRLANSRTSIAHCPSSNAALGSGMFPLREHVEAGVHCALGTDVGAGTGFSLLKEGLQAYLTQRVAPHGMLLGGSHLLYLATRAGAEALGVERQTGDFQTGKSADFVYLRARANTPLAIALDRAEDAERILSVLFTLAEADTIREVRVQGKVVFENVAPASASE